MKTTYSSYGANALKQTYQRNMLISLGIVILFTMVIVATILSLPVPVESDGTDVGPVKDSIFIVTKIPDQVSIKRDYSQWEEHIQKSRSTEGFIPVAVPDSLMFESDEQIEMYTAGSYDPNLEPGDDPNDGNNQGVLPGDGNGQYLLGEPETFEAVEIMPVFVRRQLAVYPRSAKQLGLEGVVWVRVLVDEQGLVIKVELGRTSGSESMDESALKAAGRCVFKPGIQNGRPVLVWVGFKYEFRIK